MIFSLDPHFNNLFDASQAFCMGVNETAHRIGEQPPFLTPGSAPLLCSLYGEKDKRREGIENKSFYQRSRSLCAQLYCDNLSVQMMASRDTVDLCGGPAAMPTLLHHPSLHISQHRDHDRAQMMGKEEDK